MNKSIEEWFAEQDFDQAQLPEGHRNRFKERLDALCKEVDTQKSPLRKVTSETEEPPKGTKVIHFTSWIKWGLVAGFTLMIGLTGLNVNGMNAQEQDLSSVSPEMAEAQDFFNSTIQTELERLNQEQSPDTERIIADTKASLDKLEADYIMIKKDFQTNQDSKAVIAAMITNFQTRIDLLEKALEQIEQLKTFKEEKDETII